MRIAIIGVGQLGSMLVDVLSNQDEFDVIALPHEKIDVSNFNLVKEVLLDTNPDWVINTAAFVNVDDCEKQPLKAYEVNSVGAFNIAKLSKELGFVNVYISTDFVFDGRKNKPYTEEDKPNPINVYGVSKYAGEIITCNYSSRFYVLRVASLFGPNPTKKKGIGNFVNFVYSNLKEDKPIKIIDDIYMSPTYTKDVANIIIKLIDKEPAYGIYHSTNTGVCSWYELASYIAGVSGFNSSLIKRISHKEFHRIVKRPLYSALDNKKLSNALNINIRYWKDAVRDYIENYLSKN